MTSRVALLSFRFGPTDGVSVVARSWLAAFDSFGWDCVTVAGEGDADRLVPGFGLDPAGTGSTEVPEVAALEDALADVDLVVVENLLTIPMNLPASAVVAKVLAGRPTLVHHHDPPWHRQRFAHVTELPVDDPAWRHVAISHLLAGELAERGIAASVIYNAFEPPPERSGAEQAARRAQVRDALGVDEHTVLVAHPVRAIERKNVPGALALTEALGGTYWLLGPAEEDYEPELARLLADARCPVVHRPWSDTEGIYLAADHVTYPSTWEGFGNPPIEAALHRRTVSVGAYPVAAELRALGFEWFDPLDVRAIEASLGDPDAPGTRALLDTNERVARRHFGVGRMRANLRAVLDEAGWSA